MGEIRACLFDLDGVIVDTAKFHYLAWKRLCNEMGFDFTEEDNEQLKGVSRVASLEILLKMGGVTKTQDEKDELCRLKNEWYLEYVEQMDDSEVLPGVLDFLSDIKADGIKICLGSASKNAQPILKKIGVYDQFDDIVDGTHVEKAKPDPEVFLLGAEKLGIPAENCVVFEDAAAGVEAAKAGGMRCVGIGEQDVLGKADVVIGDTHGLIWSDLKAKLN